MKAGTAPHDPPRVNQVHTLQVAAKLQETERRLREQEVVLKALTLERDQALQALRTHRPLPGQEVQVSPRPPAPRPPAARSWILCPLCSCSVEFEPLLFTFVGLFSDLLSVLPGQCFVSGDVFFISADASGSV